MSARGLRLLGLLVLVAVLGGCRGCPSSRPPIHLNPNMDNQPKLIPQAESDFFADGAAMRPPVPGTVARGELAADRGLATGRRDGALLAAVPVRLDEAVLTRGEERYDIYCGPCHGPQGDGRGMLFVRAQVESADLTSDRIRQMPAGQLFEVVSDGFGLMPGYAASIPVADRWAIVAHVRRLGGDDPGAGPPALAVPGEEAGPEEGMQDTLPEVDPLLEAPGGEMPIPGTPDEGEGVQ